jgi:hypothetical protein
MGFYQDHVLPHITPSIGFEHDPVESCLADYLASLRRHVAPGGWAVVATFGPDGPTHCSGLPIVRYMPEDLAAEFPDFDMVKAVGEDHVTPWGTNQQFTAVLLRRR